MGVGASELEQGSVGSLHDLLTDDVGADAALFVKGLYVRRHRQTRHQSDQKYEITFATMAHAVKWG